MYSQISVKFYLYFSQILQKTEDSIPAVLCMHALFACGTEAAGTPFGIIQVRNHFIGRCQNRSDHHLSDPFTMADSLCSIAVVMKSHHDFAPVVTVHHTHLIGRGQSPLACKTAPCVDQACTASGDHLETKVFFLLPF